MKERLDSIAFFTKLWWYALWGWAACCDTQYTSSAKDKYGEGVNIHWSSRILWIDTTTKYYLIKRLLYEVKRRKLNDNTKS